MCVLVKCDTLEELLTTRTARQERFLLNIAEKHAAAVVTVTEPASRRPEGEELDRWPYAFDTRPQPARRLAHASRRDGHP